jgi:hypothetical protein
MKYLVDEEFLLDYRRVFEKYADHLSHCDIVAGRRIGSSPDLDFAQCTCGYSSSIKGLQEQQKTQVSKPT